ncbi:hypothetical protein GOD94_19055 [Sinorhizobium medicae]|uniref:hypothetical protein n=1 Tax=Sinorhizobium TaxID=28105 RepID=UPI00036D192B|nr:MULTISPECIES: hypothetical protein [Sinorhizobium]MDX0443666.1 hypothetical protein [Sinorhizobium medicae]MDX0486338.1 hypothetical protein [Sinorhizobium medicae]MDX0776772.1 hypothetical protein [Sinorhizobium medicae]MDX0874998.1 hypothetical protein [Sinorhizobium medicae]MDX0997511.1 hypothetical protein [Sinorhizobium medicae]
MHGKPKNSTMTVTAICALLPDDPEAAVSVVTVACAAAAITAGLDDEATVRGLRAALISMRGNGLGDIGRKGVH